MSAEGGPSLGTRQFRVFRYAAGSNPLSLNLHPAFDLDLCERMFIRNHARLHAYAKSTGGRALTYLQPCNGFGSRPVPLRCRQPRASRETNERGRLDAKDEFYRGVTVHFHRRVLGREAFTA